MAAHALAGRVEARQLIRPELALSRNDLPLSIARTFHRRGDLVEHPTRRRARRLLARSRRRRSGEAVGRQRHPGVDAR